MSDELICSFGEPWLGPHPKCAAEVDRLCAEFDEAVTRGEMDEDGCKTDAERARQVRRLQAAGRLF